MTTVKPGPLEPPETSVIFWPAIDLPEGQSFTPEFIAEHMNLRVRLAFGKFGYQAEVTGITVRPDGSGAEVTLRRVQPGD